MQLRKLTSTQSPKIYCANAHYAFVAKKFLKEKIFGQLTVFTKNVPVTYGQFLINFFFSKTRKTAIFYELERIFVDSAGI
jgi:hypothetical protein